jgi:hypothetical protein
MKKTFLITLLAGLITLIPLAVNSGNPECAPAAPKKVEVYYFHFTRRCATCNAVETVTLETLKARYPEKIKSGEVTFRSLNLEEDGSTAIAEKLKVEGQQLLFVCDGKIVDLTDAAFMYALSKPDRLRAEVKKTVDQMLK